MSGRGGWGEELGTTPGIGAKAPNHCALTRETTQPVLLRTARPVTGLGRSPTRGLHLGRSPTRGPHARRSLLPELGTHVTDPRTRTLSQNR